MHWPSFWRGFFKGAAKGAFIGIFIVAIFVIFMTDSKSAEHSTVPASGVTFERNIKEERNSLIALGVLVVVGLGKFLLRKNIEDEDENS